MISLCNKWSWEFDVNYGVVNLINPFQSHSSIASRFEPTFLFGFFGFLFFSVLMVLSCKQFIWRSCMNTTKKKQQQSIARSGCNHYTVFTRLLVYDSLRRFLGPTYLQKDGASLHQTRDFLLNSLGGIDSLTNRSTLRKLLMNFSRLGRFGRRLTFDWVRFLRHCVETVRDWVRIGGDGWECGHRVRWVRVSVCQWKPLRRIYYDDRQCAISSGVDHIDNSLCWQTVDGVGRTPVHLVATVSLKRPAIKRWPLHNHQRSWERILPFCAWLVFSFHWVKSVGRGGGGIIEKERSDFTSSVVLSDG